MIKKLLLFVFLAFASILTAEIFRNKEPKQCNHEGHKEYANITYTTDPPQYPWKCRRCGMEGRDYGKRFNYSGQAFGHSGTLTAKNVRFYPDTNLHIS